MSKDPNNEDKNCITCPFCSDASALPNIRPHWFSPQILLTLRKKWRSTIQEECDSEEAHREVTTEKVKTLHDGCICVSPFAFNTLWQVLSVAYISLWTRRRCSTFCISRPVTLGQSIGERMGTTLWGWSHLNTFCVRVCVWRCFPMAVMFTTNQVRSNAYENPYEG